MKQFCPKQRRARFGLTWLAALVALLSLVAQSRAQSEYTLSDLSITPALTAMTGEDFTLESPVIGDGAMSLAGDDFTMQVAITPLPPVLVVGDVEVFIALDNGTVVVTWTGTTDGYVLESSPVLGDAADWQPVTPAPTDQRYVAPAQGESWFFRLRHP